MKCGWLTILEHAKSPGKYRYKWACLCYMKWLQKVCGEPWDGLPMSNRIRWSTRYKKVYKWRSTRWWHCLQTRKMEEDPENRTRWNHKVRRHNRRNVWDEIATIWAGKKKKLDGRKKKKSTLEEKYKFVTFILSRMKLSTEHRKSKNLDIEKKIKDQTPRDKGPTVQLCGDSNVACKWINGEFSLGAKYREKSDRFKTPYTCGGKGRLPNQSRTMIASWNTFTENTTGKQITESTSVCKDGWKSSSTDEMTPQHGRLLGWKLQIQWQKRMWYCDQRGRQGKMVWQAVKLQSLWKWVRPWQSRLQVCAYSQASSTWFCPNVWVSWTSFCASVEYSTADRVSTLDLGYTKRLSHNILEVSVDDVACDRWWTRVCDWLSEILRTPPVCLQLVSPLSFGSSMNWYLWLPGRGGIEKNRWRLWLAEHGTITAWISKPWERESLFCTGSGGITFQIKTAAEKFSAKCTGRAKDHILLRDDCNGQGGRMEWRTVGGVEIRGMYVDWHQSFSVRWMWTPASGCEANAPCHHGMHELGMWGFPVGTWVGDGAQRSPEGKRHVGSAKLWRLNRKFANHGTKVAKYRGTVKMAVEFTFNGPSDGVHTPRTCLLRAVSVPLCNAPDKDWNMKRTLKDGAWVNARSCCSSTMSVTTTFLMCENATGVLWRMKHYCLDDVSLLLVFWNRNWHTDVCWTPSWDSTASSSLVHRESLTCFWPWTPRGWSVDPREAPRAMAQESMFWEIVPENVFEVPA